MQTKRTDKDEALLTVLAIVRGLRPETAIQYPILRDCGNVEALRQRLNRLKQSGLVATSSTPSGSQIYRLSHKGVRLTSSPPAWATSPTENIAAEMLSVSAYAYRPEYLFLTSHQLTNTLKQLSADFEPPTISGRFLLQMVQLNESASFEAHLHYWLVELRPIDQLAKRIETLGQRFQEKPCLAQLIQVGLFGISVVVPSEGARTALAGMDFPVATHIVVVPEVAALIKGK